MVQQISALIVQPAVDASKYTAGAHEKVAADRAMAASSREAGAAATDTSAKISTSGDVLARLSRQYVEGYAAQQRFNQGLNQLNRGLETGKINVEGAERILVGMNQRLGLMANAADLAARGQNELAAAVTRANAQIERQATGVETSSRRIQAANSNRGVNFAAINATSQLQDIFVSAQGGLKVQTIALQQGTQLGMALQASLGEQGAAGAAKTLGSAILGLFSPINLISIGITAAAAATIQWFTSGEAGAKKMETALKDHSETLRLLKQQYGDLGTSAKTLGTFGGTAFTDAEARSSQTVLQALIRSQTAPFLDTLGGNGLSSNLFGRNGNVDALRNLSGDQRQFAAPVQALIDSAKSGRTDLAAFNAEVERLYGALAPSSGNPTALRNTADAIELLGQSAFEVSGKFAPFTDAINKLRVERSSGLPAFIAEVERIGRTTGLQKLADEAIVAGKELVGLSEKLREVEEILRRIDRENTRPGLRDQRDLQRYVAGRNADLRIVDQQFAADQQLARARTNAERLAAIEAQVRARAKQDGDSGGGLQARVDRALAEERTRQEVEARDATIERSQAIQRTLDQQRIELDLVGKTTSEQAKLRFEFERMQELREQAVRTGDPIDQKEVDKIKAAADAMGQYADALARAKLGDELSFEADQLRRTSQDQQIASRLRGAGLPVDLNGQVAQQMRDNQYYSDARDAATGFAKTFGQELISSGGDIGKSLAKALENSLLEATSKAWEKLADQLGIAFANWLTGGSGASAGGGAGAFGTASGVADLLFGGGAANDNTVTRAPLADIGSTLFKSAGVTKTGIPLSQIGAQGLSARVNSDYAARFQGLLSDLTAAGYPITSLGEGGYSYRNVAGSSHLSNHAFGNAIDINPRQNPWAVGAKGNFAQYGVDPNEIAQRNGLFWGGNWNKSDAMHFQVDKTVKSLDKLSTSSIDTAQSLSGGLGKLGSSLSQFPAAPSGGGGGGLFSWLGGLFGGGGLSSAFSGTSAFSWLSANPGGYIGLYADGTENAPPGWAWVGERGPELMRMRGGEVVRTAEKSRQMTAANGNSGPFDVHVVSRFDADGGFHTAVERVVDRRAPGIARQHASSAVADYDRGQRRGGFGQTQKRYSAQKG